MKTISATLFIITIMFISFGFVRTVQADDQYDHTDHGDGKGCFSPCYTQPPHHTVPEPESLALLAVGGIALWINVRRRNSLLKNKKNNEQNAKN